jgi:cold shock CspA family protein
MENTGYVGVIKTLHPERGFGFVMVEGFEQNIFFHARDLRRIHIEDLRKGDKLRIETINPNDRPNKAGQVVQGLIAKEIYLIS